MHRHGFELFINERPQPPRDFPYGNVDVGFARKHGLGLDTGTVAQAVAANPNKTYVEGLPESRRRSYAIALDGANLDVSVTAPNGYTAHASSAGCVAEAQRELYGSFEDWFRVNTLVEQLATEVDQRMSADGHYAGAAQIWAACMREFGLSAADPGSLRAHFAAAAEKRRDTHGRAGPVSQEEVAAALAEVHCTKRSRLHEIGPAVRTRHEAAVRAAHHDLVQDYQRLRVEALPRASANAD
jgi:hypothetical protein